jgi:hypothetical protein
MWLSLLKNWKMIIVGITLLGSFYAGYIYSTYQHQSDVISDMIDRQDILREYMARESEIASIVEERLSTLSANERVLERERVRIVEKPVYNISCIDADGQALIKRYALGASIEGVGDE